MDQAIGFRIIYLPNTYVMYSVAYRIFLWGGGGHTLVRPLGVWWHAPPENSTLDFDLILGGGGLKLEGGNPSVPPPPPLYATLMYNIRMCMYVVYYNFIH